MGNSALATYTKLSPHRTSPRQSKIDTITIHCYVGQTTVQSAGAWFASPSAKCSCNYVVDKNGKVGLIVPESNRAWCSSSGANDHRAVTIEVASDRTHPYAVNDKAYAALLDLVADICRRNGIKKLVWSTSKADRVGHKNGCNMTVHRDFANKACPGKWLYDRHGQIAAAVNKRLGVAEDPVVKVAAADKYSKAVARRYTVNATSGLWLRADAGEDKAKLALLPHSLAVHCYGYYKQRSGVRWLYVKVTDSGNKALYGKVGFVCGTYLK